MCNADPLKPTRSALAIATSYHHAMALPSFFCCCLAALPASLVLCLGMAGLKH
eukprot:m.76464 g.76464  ORF g.76464 m.76464 type:complete len:53 (-) comp14432_c0_seq4:285-443(-)